MPARKRPSKFTTTLVVLGTALLACLALQGAVASAASAAPQFRIDADANSSVASGDQLRYTLQVTNTGDAATSGSWSVEVNLPAELSASGFSSFMFDDCSAAISSDPRHFTCTSSAALSPRQVAISVLTVDAAADAAGPAVARFEASGGGAADVEASDATDIAAGAPEFGIDQLDAGTENADGSAYFQAGGTPATISNTLSFNTKTDPRWMDFPGLPTSRDLAPVEAAKDVRASLPAGLVGGTRGLATCDAVDLAAGPSTGFFSTCPAESQVGTITIGLNSIGTNNHIGYLPIFNMDPPPGVLARFGFEYVGTVVVLDASVRSGSDFGLDIVSENTTEALPLFGTHVEFWGAPADPSHDVQRACPGYSPPYFGTYSGFSVASPPSGDASLCPYERPPVTRMLRTPTACTGAVETKATIDSWEHPGATSEDGTPDLDDPNWKVASVDSHAAPGAPLAEIDWGPSQGYTNCNAVPFNPQVSVEATSDRSDSPTGLAVDISVPQTSDPTVLGSSDLKDAEVTLPEGFSLNPSAADGLKACTLEQIDLDGDNTEPDCPKASKIGTTEIETPLLDDPLTGSVYLAEQDDPDEPGHENPFDTLTAYYIVAEGPGTVIKLAGKVELDQDTGQITNTFTNQPQLPFSNFHVEFFDGPRSPLATPQTCTDDAATVELTPWARPGSPVSRTSTVPVTEGPDGGDCAATAADRPFDPTLKSGTIDNTAGSFSPFIFRLTRQDGEQEILSTEVTPPEGLTGKLAGIPLCSDEDAEAGTCDESSKVGEVIAGAGAGPTPFYIQGENAGSVYLAGPYKGAPLSLQIQVPAIAGPFDLGMVNVRAAMFLDKRTAQLNIISDPIPQIMEGIPLRVKDLRIRMNRDAFTIAPTNCNEMQVAATAQGVNGAEADLRNRFQVGDCASLDFSPKLNLAYRGKGSGRRNGHPKLAANLKVPGADDVASGAGASEANLDKVRVILPRGTFLDQDALSRVCTPTQWEAEDCPADSKIGNAKAWTPLLDEPLRGPVYLKVGPNELPDLAADLNGVVDIDLFGKIDQSKGRIRNTFNVIPDVAVERFRLNLKGGSGGLLVNSRRICGGKNALRRANVTMKGQNGAALKSKQSVVKCGGKKKRKSRRR